MTDAYHVTHLGRSAFNLQRYTPPTHREPTRELGGSVDLSGILMDAQFLASLRCPIDPQREALLTQVRDQLVCSECTVRFPVKNGLPILIADQAELPVGCDAITQLPCLRRK